MTAAESDRLFRAAVLIACGIGTLLWLAGFIPVIRAKNPDAFNWIIVFFATPIYAVSVVPAFLFALAGGRASLYIAAGFLVSGAAVAVYIFQ